MALVRMPAVVNVSCCLLAVTLLAGESETALASCPSAPAQCAPTSAATTAAYKESHLRASYQGITTLLLL
eukprot:19766-Heterococcus_DN1.PRE.3